MTAVSRRRDRAKERHAELLAALASVRDQQKQHLLDCADFLRDAAALEKSASVKAVRDLQSLTPEVTVLCAQTGAVVERIANANDVAAKMTKEVRRIDILQSRLTATLAQSSQLLSLRNALTGIRRAMQLHNYPEAATFLKQLKEIEKIMPLDVADKLRVDTIESDLKGIIESALEEGLVAGDRARVQTYSPLFQIVGIGYEERGFVLLLGHITRDLDARLEPMTKGSFSTKELMDHLTIIFNLVAAVAQEYDQLTTTCFPHVSSTQRLIKSIYSAGEKASVVTLASYMAQRKFHDRMSESSARVETVPSGGPIAAGAGKAPMTAADAEDAIAIMNEQLNEVALIIQHTQTYERFMRSRVADLMTTDDQGTVLPASSESELGRTVQELAGFYCFFENELLTKAAQKAFQWEELRSLSAVTDASQDDAHVSTAAAPAKAIVTYPVSSAIDEIFYVARNSGLRGLATGHADCAAGVLNIINTVLRDALGDNMRSRIRNMASHLLRLEQESGLLAASNQFRDQMQQQLAKLSKIQGVGLGSAIGGTPGSPSIANAGAEAQKELGPGVVMNSLEVTLQYITQLKSEFEAELVEDFEEVPTHVRTCLNALDDALSELKQLLIVSRKKLCKVLENKLTSGLSPLLSTNGKKIVSYELTDQAFTMNEANDPFAHQFVVVVRETVRVLQPSLSPSNCTAFIEGLGGATAEILEQWFHSRHVRFTALGALQFDKDLRVISGFFNELADCRARFAVLTQIAMVLSVDGPSDVQDFFGRRARGGVEWKLSAAQVKEILSRRTEFNDAAINALAL